MADVDVTVLTGARLCAGGQVPAQPVDIAVAHGRVVAIAPHLDLAQMPAGGRVIPVDGRWVLPGLADHHVHFSTWARQRARVCVVGAPSAASAARTLAHALAARAAQGGPAAARTLVGYGFQDALWPAAPTGEDLDQALAAVGQHGAAVVVISHDMHSVWLNAAAATRYGAPHAGLLREDEAFLMEQVVDAEAAPFTAGLIAQAVQAAAARGVTQIVDFQMEDNLATWRGRMAAGLTSLRVRAGLYPEHVQAAMARGDRTGDVVPGTRGLLTVGPLKIFGDGALNTRTALCTQPYPDAPRAAGGGFGVSVYAQDELTALMTRAHGAGLEVALHAIGDLAVTRALDAFAASGARGSVEHAQLVAPADLPRFAALGVAASVQPVHALDDRDVADAVWADRAQHAFPLAALAHAGARLALGSDAPVAPLDPWAAVGAAVARTDDDRAPWQGANALTVAQALAASQAHPQVREGCDADLVVVDRDPYATDPRALADMPVALTMCAGRITHTAVDAARD